MNQDRNLPDTGYLWDTAHLDFAHSDFAHSDEITDIGISRSYITLDIYPAYSISCMFMIKL